MIALRGPDSCPLCHSKDIFTISADGEKSLRSDGLIRDCRLQKLHCRHCGLAWSHYEDIDSRIPYLRSNGSSSFEISRCHRLSNGLKKLFVDLQASLPNPFSILEVGGGSFYTSQFLAESMPDNLFVSLEVSPERSPVEIDLPNLECKQQLLEDHAGGPYSVIFANMVLEHQANPILFLRKCQQLLSDRAFIAIIVPNADLVDDELMFSDHLFHFTSSSFVYLAGVLGLHLVHQGPAPWDSASSIFILSNDTSSTILMPNLSAKGYPIFATLDSDANQSLLENRIKHIKSWSSNEEAVILRGWDNSMHYFLFGAGEFAQLVECYMPELYSRLMGCIVTDIDGARPLNKTLFEANCISDKNCSAVLLGVKRESRSAVRRRLTELGFRSSNIIDFQLI